MFAEDTLLLSESKPLIFVSSSKNCRVFAALGLPIVGFLNLSTNTSDLDEFFKCHRLRTCHAIYALIHNELISEETTAFHYVIS